MDRFAMQFTLGYVQPTEEVAVLTAQANNHPLEALGSCATFADVTAQAHRAEHPHQRGTQALRGGSGRRDARSERCATRASPRASIALMKAAQALALFDGRIRHAGTNPGNWRCRSSRTAW